MTHLPTRLIAGGAILCALTLTLTLVASCSGRQEEVDLAYPLSRKITFFGTKEVFISAAPEVELADLCDLSIFGDLIPGMSEAEVARILGPPIDHHMERSGRDEVYTFNLRDGAAVEVIEQASGSEDVLVRRWVLRYSATGRSLSDLVSPEVLDAIPPEQRGFILHLDDSRSAARVELPKNEPLRIWWLAASAEDSTSQPKE